jgi:DnaJ like chaperone protein
MSWNGKILGGLMGFAAFGGPVGAALGAFIGHQYDAYVDARAGAGAGAGVQRLFFPATFRLMGHIAKADGRVSEQEIAAARALMLALHLNGAQTQAAIAHFGEGKQPDYGLDSAMRELRAALAPYPQLAQFFIELQLQFALAGNGLAGPPREQLQRAAQLLGIEARDFARLESMMRWRAGAQTAGATTAGTGGQRERMAQAYALLEVAAEVSDAELVKAYRRQMSRHHPDKLQANGLPESMLERAKERTQQIQAAYELLRTARGMR